ncbi:MAG TPA: RnfABCDGE type electron transport complex subunit B [Longimicrobiales bacterium]|nr:RnfABCDGE type electron transport complex subunit B [Longimicrobiales bacterium]
MIAPGAVLGSAAILGGVGLTFGILIALANARLKVWEDPRIEGVNALLPGANCGACGFAGCRAFAEAVIRGETPPATCTVMSEGEREEVAGYLGVDAGEADRRVARLLCAGAADVAPWKADYVGIESCAAAAAVSGGGKGCPWGCLGLGDCAVSCDFEAIAMSPLGLPVVTPELCTACEDCVEACPLDLFVVMPMDHHLVVQCRSLLEGDEAESVCSVACNACRRCVQDAPDGLIDMVDGLAVVNYERIELENPGVVERCPTGAIVWLEGRQFPAIGSPVEPELAYAAREPALATAVEGGRA